MPRSEQAPRLNVSHRGRQLGCLRWLARPFFSPARRLIRDSSHSPSLVLAQIILVKRVVGVMLFRTVGILGHFLEGQRLDSVAGGGEQRAILAITPGLEHEAAFPA